MRGIEAANTKNELSELGIQPHAVLSIADLLERTMRESRAVGAVIPGKLGFQDFEQNVQSGYSHIFHFKTCDVKRAASAARKR